MSGDDSLDARREDNGHAEGRRDEDRRDLTTGAVWWNLVRLAGPMLFGIAAVISVQLVDTFFVGRLGTGPLAALSFSFPVSLTLTSLSIGLSAGAASVVSRAIGRRHRRRARRLATDSLLLAVLIVLLITLAGLATVEPVLRLVGARGEVLELAMAYMRIWYLSLPFVVVPMVANAMVRACGDAFWPSAIMITASLINVAVTPVLVFGLGPVPALGIEGAALGTLVARVISSAMALHLVLFRDRLVVPKLPDPSRFLRSAAQVLRIGVPAAAGNASNPVGIGLATAVIAVLGAETVAAFGVATRIEAFAVLPMLALSSAIGPVVGQNWGSGRRDRVRRALAIAYAMCVGWSVVLAIVFWTLGRPIAALFASEPSVADEAARYLHIVPLSLGGYGIAIVAAGGYNGLGKSMTGLAYSLSRTMVFYVPLVWIASRIDGSTTVYGAISAANALAGIAIAVHSLWWVGAAERHGRERGSGEAGDSS